ncbi:MAG: methyl-accepting chemotaxis protein [Gammaproteobacteria bacterium]|nr:MAG: methyl-accepting chemotaxis protein [Gammaproteobacteria bacterium]
MIKTMRRWSLSSLNITPKLLVLTGVPLALLLLGMALILVMQIHGRVVPMIHASSEQLTAGGSQQVAWWVQSHRNTVATLARVPELASGDADMIAAFMQRYGRFKDDAHEVVLFADVDGEAYYHNAHRANLADRGYFRQIVVDGTAESVVSDPVLSRSTGNPIAVMAHAVRDRGNQTVGLVLATVTLDMLSVIADEAALQTGGAFGWIMTADGTVIAHPDPAKRLNLNALQSDAEGYVGLAQVAREMVSGASGMGTYTDNGGRPMSVTYRAIDGTPGWSFAMSMPTATLMETSRALLGLVAVLFALALAAMAAVVVFSARLIARPIARTTLALNDIAEGEGDLTRRLDVPGTDELARLAAAFNRFAERIQALVRQLASAAAQLAAAAEELSASSEQSTREIGRQQSETDQVATAMNEMTATVQDVARSANEAARSAQQTDDQAAAGRDVVSLSIDSIQSLAAEVEDAAGVIQRLSSHSEEIGTVLDVIRGIAEQTNLLALNAAIEAARAGEQGRGFAVVADEVRTLASRTQTSTQEIQRMIEGLQGNAGKAVEAMEKGRLQAKDSVEQAGKAGESLEAITVAVRNISDMNTQIASAAEEQSAVAEEINRNVANIGQSIDETARGSAQISGASQELARLAADLQEKVGQFKV